MVDPEMTDPEDSYIDAVAAERLADYLADNDAPYLDAAILAAQDAAPDVGLFIDGQFLGAVGPGQDLDAARAGWARLLRVPVDRLESLKVCPTHPTVPVIDCTDCIPVETQP